MNPLFIENLKSYLLGEKHPSFYCAGMIMASLGVLISLYYSSQKRNKLNPETPEKFSWIFLIWDGAKRFVVGLILLFVFFRFTPEMDMMLAVGMGIILTLAFDRLIEYLMKKTDFLQVLEMNREKFPVIPANLENKGS